MQRRAKEEIMGRRRKSGKRMRGRIIQEGKESGKEKKTAREIWKGGKQEGKDSGRNKKGK